jgi:hypothetical protein
MFVLAVVEIERTSAGGVPSDLVRLAYTASRRGCIALLLNGVTAEEVDAVVDDLVPTMPLSIPGLLYIDARNFALLAEASSEAAMIFVSEATRLRCAVSLGLQRFGVRQLQTASEALGRIARPARIAELAARYEVASRDSY